MTRYEKLIHKAELCRQAAGKTKGKMKRMWIEKANALEIEAGNLPLVKANERS